ncbi:hypothetical protein JCM10213_006712 [Rhodosporidiobolus nylandii]
MHSQYSNLCHTDHPSSSSSFQPPRLDDTAHTTDPHSLPAAEHSAGYHQDYLPIQYASNGAGARASASEGVVCEGVIWVPEQQPVQPGPDGYDYGVHGYDQATIQQPISTLGEYDGYHLHPPLEPNPQQRRALYLPPEGPAPPRYLQQQQAYYAPAPDTGAPFAPSPSPSISTFVLPSQPHPPAPPTLSSAAPSRVVLLPPPGPSSADDSSQKRRRVSFTAPSPALSERRLTSGTATGSGGATASASVARSRRTSSTTTVSTGAMGEEAETKSPLTPAAAQFSLTPVAGAGGSAAGHAQETKVKTAEKSCKNCRARKVRCSRHWPSCARCSEKKLDCHYGNLVPIDLVKNLNPDSRVVELEARIKSLELELAAASAPAPPSPSISPASSTTSSLSSLPLASAFPSQLYDALLSPILPSLVASPALQHSHVAAVLASVEARASSLPSAWTQGGRFGPPTACGAGGGASAPAPGGSEEDERAWEVFRQMVEADKAAAEEVRGKVERGELGWTGLREGQQKETWERWVVWGLLDAFWAQCSSNVPAFLSFHAPSRKLPLYTSLSSLSPSDRVCCAAFCALGVRSSLDLPLLGLSDAPCPVAPASAPRQEGEPSVAVRRELQARSLRGLMLALYDELGIAHGEGTRGALEASVVAALVMMWNELHPYRSRSLVRVALGLYRDLIDSHSGEAEGMQAKKTELVMKFGLVLLVQDSTTSAYLRSSPLISPFDLSTYFAPFPLPCFTSSLSSTAPPAAPSKLSDDIATFCDLDRLSGADHMGLMMGSMIVYKWLAGCLRAIAEMSCPRAQSQPIDPSALPRVFSALDQIHAALQTFQHHFAVACASSTFAHPSCLAAGPSGDTCESVHLRWCTRLDREVDDCVWLMYAAAGERMLRDEKALPTAAGSEDTDEEVGGVGQTLSVKWLQMCEGRVRKGLKSAAFYFNFFTLSPDPHQTHHLAWCLELIPSWTFLATQRYIPSPAASRDTTPAETAPGLGRKQDELTPLELDWIEAGLREASKYHPVAEKRLVEIKAFREGNERRALESGVVTFPTRATPCSPPILTAASFAPTASGGGGKASSTASKVAAGTRLTFQEAMQVALRMSVPNWA